MNNLSATPASSNRSSRLPFAYIDLRGKFLKTIMVVASIIGLGIVIANIRNSTPLTLVAMVTLFLLLVAATFLPVRYGLKAGTLLGIAFLLGLKALLGTGIFGNAGMLLLVFALFAGIFFGRREFWIAIAIDGILIALAGWLLSSNIVSLVTTQVSVGSLSTWIIQTFVMLLVATAIEEAWRRLSREYLVTQATLKNAMTTLSSERTNLDYLIIEKTKDTIASADRAAGKADHLRAIAEITNTLAYIQETEELLPAICHQIGDRFSLFHVALYLNDEKNEFSVLIASSSAGGARLLERGYKLQIGRAGIINSVAASGEAHVSPKIKDDLLYEPNPDLPETRSIMALPLKYGQRILGVLDLESSIENDANFDDPDTMRLLADQVATFIENTRVFSENRRALAEARAVYGHYMREAWDQFSQEKGSAGYRYEGARVDPIEKPLEHPEIISAMDSGQPFSSSAEQSSLAIPLKLRDEVIGVLDIRSSNPQRKFNEHETALVQAVADRVALALENARLFEETTRRADRERTVSDITTRIRSTTDPQLMLQTALEELKRALGAKDVLIRPYSPPPADQKVN